MALPVVSAAVLAQAAKVWSDVIAAFGREVTFRPNDGSADLTGIKAFCKRPKILGLFDRTEQSYDQTRFMVLVNASDMTAGVDKFDRVRWDDEDHAVISSTQVDLSGVVFGYRILVKG